MLCVNEFVFSNEFDSDLFLGCFVFTEIDLQLSYEESYFSEGALADKFEKVEVVEFVFLLLFVYHDHGALTAT